MDSNGYSAVILFVENVLFNVILKKYFFLIKVIHGHYRKFGKYKKAQRKKLKICNFTIQREILLTWWCI